MKERSSLSVFLRLGALVRPLAGWMALAVLLGLAGFLCAIAIPVLGGYSALLALQSRAFPSGLLVLSLAAAAVLRGFLRYGEQTCNHYIAFRLLALIRDRVFAALRRLAPAKLDGREKGALISLITSDVELLEVFYAHTISPVLIALLLSLGMAAFIGSFHWLLGAIALIAYATVGIVIPLVYARRAKPLGKSVRANMARLSSYLLDSLRGLKETLQYGTGGARLSCIHARTEELLNTDRALKKLSAESAAMSGFAVTFFSLAVLYVSALLSIHGDAGFEGVLIPTIAMFSSFGAVIAVANLGSGLSQTVAAGRRVLDLLDELPAVADLTSGASVAFADASVQNVSFGYGAKPVLRSVSAEIPAGEIIGITGRSGSGKSTLLRLLMRFFDPQTGKIALSGVQLSQINTSCLRGVESFVAQEVELFHDSIEENIRIGRRDATHEQIVSACKKASLHDFILSLPNGYDTEVGELGETLSGGERQRIGLARAFLHDAPLLLLDEPTSNLDSLNEAIILKALAEDKKRTIVLVSHRASTMRIARRVYSVESGRLS